MLRCYSYIFSLKISCRFPPAFYGRKFDFSNDVARYIRCALYFRIYSLLGELSYIKGKMHKNSMCQVQARQRKFNCYNNYVLHISLPRRTIGNFNFGPVYFLDRCALKTAWLATHKRLLVLQFANVRIWSYTSDGISDV